MSKNLEKTYNPKEIEAKLYEKWCEEKYFHAEVDRSKKPFTTVMPPPNITGKLHMGHALDNTLQDILIRYKRMQGYNALWIPGTDHAAISTEVKVTNQLKAEETAQVLEEEKKKIVVVALVDTLEYLKRGGRISKTAAFAGGVLNIKPVLSVIDGEIHLLGKARGSKMGNNLLVQEIDKAGGIDFSRPVLLGYSGISDALLLKYIEDSRHIWEGNLKEIRYTTVGSVIGTHAGPGAVVVAFFKK